MPEKKYKIDYVLLVLFLVVLGLGLMTLFSASSVVSMQKFDTPTYYFTRQILNGVLPGLVLAFIGVKVHYKFWGKISFLLVLLALFGLLVLEIDTVGRSLNGAVRWIHVGPVFFQPSEFAKFSLIAYTAAWVSKKYKNFKDFTLGLLPLLLVLFGFAILLIRQPDVGTMSVMIATCFVMLFLGGVPMRYYLGLIALSGVAFAVTVKYSAYRLARLLTFLGHTQDPHGTSYHINQSLIAIGVGGMWGVGYGLSRQKYGYLPESMGDSIFAIFAEENGYVKTIAMLVVLLLFLARIFYISMKTKDLFGKIMGLGIGTLFSLHILVNVCSMVKLLPLTGIPLPFFSQGGSNMLISCFMVGILFNIYARGNDKDIEKPDPKII